MLKETSLPFQDIPNEVAKKYNEESLLSAMQLLVAKAKIDKEGIKQIYYRDVFRAIYCLEQEDIEIMQADGSIKKFVLTLKIWSYGANHKPTQRLAEVFINLNKDDPRYIARREYKLQMELRDEPNKLRINSDLDVNVEYARLGIGGAMFRGDAIFQPLLEEYALTQFPNLEEVEILYSDATSGNDNGWTTRQVKKVFGIDMEEKEATIHRPINPRKKYGGESE